MEISSINTQCTAIIFIRWLPSTTKFPEAKLSSTFLSPIFWKYSKTLQQQPENIQRHFRLQICLSRELSTIFRKYSKTFGQQSTAATINQQQQSAAPTSNSNQQYQPAATTSSNQQQLSTAAINSSNQQHQPAAATSSSDQQHQPVFVLPASLPQSTTTHVR